MTVNVSKPAINLREKLAELDKPTGIAGEAMLRAETPQEQFNLIGAGHRNLVYNGAMQVWQRGTSFTNLDYEYGADRWQVYQNGTGTLDVDRSTDAPSGFPYSMKITCGTADTSIGATDFGGFNQLLEAQDIACTGLGTSGAKGLTLSFWVKSNVAGQYSVVFRQPNTTVDYYAVTYTVDSPSTWEYKTVYMAPDTSVGNWTLTGNGIGFEVTWNLWVGSTYGTTTTNTWVGNSNKIGVTGGVNFASSTSNEFYITGVQLELGKVATPFEHRSYGEELALCKRYFQKSTEQSINPANGPNTTSFASSMGNTLNLVPVAIWSQAAHIYLPVEMRAAPTMTRYGNSQGYWGYLSVGTAGPSGLSSINFHQNVYIGGTPKTVYVNNQVSTNPMWGAKGMWEADAEL